MFALVQWDSKAKHCRNVLGRVLGRKNKIQNQSFSLVNRSTLQKQANIFRAFKMLCE